MSKNHKHYPAPEMVNLGLPSGIKWAKWNVGASKETDYGLYFKYGEAEGHTSKKLVHFNRSYPETFTDAATAAYGAGYRMPTKDELQELIDGTDREVSIINGVKGMKYMRKSDHNIYIFIPFAGFFGIYGSLLDAGSGAYVWNSAPDGSYAYSLDCDDCGSAYTNSDDRSYGYSVRAVSEKSFKKTKEYE